MIFSLLVRGRKIKCERARLSAIAGSAFEMLRTGKIEVQDVETEMPRNGRGLP